MATKIIEKKEKVNFFQKIKSLFSSDIKAIISNTISRRSYRASKQANSNYLSGRVTTAEDYDLYTGLDTLRARSRSLAQNNPIMKHYLMMLDGNVVGKDGFKNQILGIDTNGKLDIVGNQAVSRAWMDFTKAENCDISNKNNLTKINSIIVKTLAKDGEALIRLVKGR